MNLQLPGGFGVVILTIAMFRRKHIGLPLNEI
jgi:hypothetical protein